VRVEQYNSTRKELRHIDGGRRRKAMTNNRKAVSSVCLKREAISVDVDDVVIVDVY